MLLNRVEHLLRVELGDERGRRAETEGDGRVAGVARPKSQWGRPADNIVLRDLPTVLPETVRHDQQFLHEVDGPFRTSGCARGVQQQADVFAFAEHWIDAWIAG